MIQEKYCSLIPKGRNRGREINRTKARRKPNRANIKSCGLKCVWVLPLWATIVAKGVAPGPVNVGTLDSDLAGAGMRAWGRDWPCWKGVVVCCSAGVPVLGEELTLTLWYQLVKAIDKYQILVWHLQKEVQAQHNNCEFIEQKKTIDKIASCLKLWSVAL